MKILYLYAILTADSMKTRLALLLCLFLPLALMAQKITVEEYIEAYKDIAMREMKEHKIPATITLAQLIQSLAAFLIRRTMVTVINAATATRTPAKMCCTSGYSIPKPPTSRS